MVDMSGRPPAHEVARVYELISGVAASAAICAAVRLGLFDAFGIEPCGADALAARVGADGDSVNRLLRALASFGLVDEVRERFYQQNPASQLLWKDSVGSVADLCRLMDWSLDIWQYLGEAVRRGTPAFPLVYGMHLDEYLAFDAPQDGDVFDRAMNGNTRLAIEHAVDAMDLAGVGTVADIGGGRGLLLREVLTRNPAVRGVLFDQEAVLRRAGSALVPGRLADRVDLVAGDCRRAVPVRADLYLVKQVLHNWDDGTAVRILSNIGAAAPVGARVIVLDLLVDDGGPMKKVHAGMDLLMMLFVGGKERTEEQFADLFRRAGLDFHGASPIADGLVGVIEGQVRRSGPRADRGPLHLMDRQ